jgi:hypothetical protein
MKVLKEGYKPQFSAPPPTYRENNNRSAERKLYIVREKVKEWEDDGFVTRLTVPQHGVPTRCQWSQRWRQRQGR